jgi:signal peptidase I
VRYLLLAAAALVLLASASVVLRLRSRFVVVTVEGASMTPTYAPGDRLLVRRHGAAVRAGEVVVFAWPPTQPSVPPGLIVKRVVAVAGDPPPPPVLAALGATAVPSGHVAVLGDGAWSADSRHFGYLAVDQIIGTVVRPVYRRRDHVADQPGRAGATES